MKGLLVWLGAVLLALSGCSALPGEERAFAVAMGIEKAGGIWQASARIPTYQTGGGYLTLSAKGDSLGEAMALLNVSAPMELHYGQVRLVVFSAELAQDAGFGELLGALAARGEIRPQAVVTITEDAVAEVLDAMVPATGSRLSKSLETLLDARERTGAAELVTLDSLQRMGERQQPVLMNIALEPSEAAIVHGMDAAAGQQPVQGAGKVQFAGGWMMNHAGRTQGVLSAAEMQLMALMRGRLQQGTLALSQGTLTLLNTKSNISWENDEIMCRLSVTYSASSMTEEGVINALLKDLHSLTDKLSKAGCDAFGVGRKLMRGCMTMEEWRSLNWPERYLMAKWRFVVKADREA